MDLTQSTIFVTGAAGGIGRCVLQALQDHGAGRIYAADLQATSAGLSDVTPIDLDITDDASVARAATAAADTTILINIAGLNLRSKFLGAPSLTDARREMDTNYFGTLAMCRAFAPILVANRAPAGAAILNMLSVLARVTLPNVGTYCASKGALAHMTEGLRIELKPEGIQVIGVFPWAVSTAMSGPFTGVKVSPQDVAARTVEALQQDLDEVYLHPFSPEIDKRLVEDARALQAAVTS